jgi:hypothetical protein
MSGGLKPEGQAVRRALLYKVDSLPRSITISLLDEEIMPKGWLLWMSTKEAYV